MRTKTLLTVALLLMTSVAFAQSDSRLEIDFQAPTRPRSSLATFSVGSDRAMIFLRPEHQRDLLTLQKEVGFRYLRCHGLFNEEMKVVSRNTDGTLRFDWTNVDLFIDQSRKAKLKPFFELGFMPEPLASGKQTIFWWKGNVTPPAQMTEWSLLVESFARHVIARYGIREVPMQPSVPGRNRTCNLDVRSVAPYPFGYENGVSDEWSVVSDEWTVVSSTKLDGLSTSVHSSLTTDHSSLRATDGNRTGGFKPYTRRRSG